MKLTKKELKEIMKLPYNEKNEQRVIKALEGMKDNKDNLIAEIGEKSKKLDKLTFIVKNGSKIPQSLKDTTNLLETQIMAKKRLLNSWVKPTINDLNDKYSDFALQKYKDVLEDYVEEIIEEE